MAIKNCHGAAVLLGNAIADFHGGAMLLGNAIEGFHGAAVLLGMSLHVVKRIVMSCRLLWVSMVGRCYWGIQSQVVKRIVLVASGRRWVADGGAVLVGNAIAGFHGGAVLSGNAIEGFHGAAVLLGMSLHVVKRIVMGCRLLWVAGGAAV